MSKVLKLRINYLSYLFTIALVTIFIFFGLKTVYASATVVNINTDIVAAVSSSAPEYIVSDSDGNVYISGANTGNVKKFNSQGDLLLTIGQSGTGDGEFDTPAGIAAYSDPNIFYKIIFAIITTGYLIRFIVKTTNIASQFHADSKSLA